MSVDVRPVSKRGTVGVPPENDTFGAIDQPNGTSTVPRVSAPAALVSDEFERTSASTIGSPDVGPAPAVKSAASVFGVADGHNLGLVTHGSGTWDVAGWDAGKKNVVVAADLTFGAAPSAGLAFRIVDGTNFLAVELADTTVKIFKVVAGTRTDLATATIASTKNGTHRVTACIDVDLVAVHVDEVPVVSYFLSTGEFATFGTETVHGYWQAGAESTVAARISIFPVTQRAIYNGTGPTTAAPYQLFKASSVAGATWFKGPTSIIAPPGGTAAQMKDPCPFYVGTRLWCFYTGVGSPTTLQQAHAMYSDSDGAIGTWVQSPNNPVLPAGTAGSCDSTSCTFPIVLVDPSDTSAPIKVVYNGFDGTTRTVCLATGLVPDSLTKWSGNPAIRPSSSVNAWDALGVWPGAFHKIGNLWHVMLEGRYQASKENIGHATASSFLSRWTKDPANPLFSAQRQKSVVLTANWPSGSATVTVGVAGAVLFTRGEPVIVSLGANGTTGGVLTWVVDIDAEAGTLTVNDVAPSAAFTTAAGARIRSVWQAGLAPRSVVYETNTGKYVMSASGFRAFPNDLRETSVSMAAPSLSGPWAPQYGRGLLWPLGGVTSADEISAENPWIIPVPAA